MISAMKAQQARTENVYQLASGSHVVLEIKKHVLKRLEQFLRLIPASPSGVH